MKESFRTVSRDSGRGVVVLESMYVILGTCYSALKEN